MTLVTRKFVLLLCCVGALGASGCGSQTYEERLEASAAYFKYRQLVDSLVQEHAWSAEGITFRPPHGFGELPAPPPPKDEDAPPPEDTRQPAFLTHKLPGLVGAWQSQLRVEIPDSDVEELPGWILICTNHDYHRQKFDNPRIIPAAFMDDATNALADSLGFARNSAVDPWQFSEVRAPSGTAYVPRKDYDWIPLTDPELNFEVDGQRARYDFRLYRYFVGSSIQFTLVTVIPSDEILARSARPYDAIDMAIEQLTVTDEVPRTRTAAPANAPASGGGF
ncbi:MAG: hypothetical protein ACYTGL_06590 [Planctomycetota bacterium]|jgi:hypothetical protein